MKAGLDWAPVVECLDRDGFAVTPWPVLDADQCLELRSGFDAPDRFRSTIDMARHRFGEGCYRYYANPLPGSVAGLRAAAYPPLAALANTWAERLGQGLGQAGGFPDSLSAFIEVCAAAGQTKPTPLILRYRPGGWNAMHQDLYGPVAFPIQFTVALSQPGNDFTGGENLLVEQRPRAQSRGTSITVPFGQALVFPTRYRPIAGNRGYYRAVVRHGVSTVTSGERYTLGVIFHNAA